MPLPAFPNEYFGTRRKRFPEVLIGQLADEIRASTGQVTLRSAAGAGQSAKPQKAGICRSLGTSESGTGPFGFAFRIPCSSAVNHVQAFLKSSLIIGQSTGDRSYVDYFRWARVGVKPTTAIGFRGAPRQGDAARRGRVLFVEQSGALVSAFCEGQANGTVNGVGTTPTAAMATNLEEGL